MYVYSLQEVTEFIQLEKKNAKDVKVYLNGIPYSPEEIDALRLLDLVSTSDSKRN